MKDYWVVLRELREDRDLKQSAVARILGTTQQVYSRYENGINEMPIRHLRALCEYYNVSADYVLSLKRK
jgi:transcriptional regulator with XRE-family HTH domain